MSGSPATAAWATKVVDRILLVLLLAGVGGLGVAVYCLLRGWS